jgi:predicted phage gp36 major capsid-like protein
MNFMQTAPETKSTGTDHVALADSFDEFMSAFEAFRDENDRRLRQIETRGAADVVTSEKVDRISDWR